jgi:hypothetical protein
MSSTFFGFVSEGPDEAMRGEGGEWEPIKILYKNLVYVPKQTQHSSLLTRSRPHSYRRTISPWHEVKNKITAETQLGASRSHKQNNDDQNQTNKLLSTSHTFHRITCVRVTEPPLKQQGFVSQYHIREFSMKREYTNTTRKHTIP